MVGLGVNDFTLRHLSLPLRSGAGLRILHISDIHYIPGQRKKFDWLQSLAELEPDLVVNTGDNLSHLKAVDEVLEALTPLLQFPGVFVPGSNDYYAPKWKNPLRYLSGPSRLDEEPEELEWRRLFTSFEAAGWRNLSNHTAQLTAGGHALDFSGVDDPHIGRDEFQGWPGAVPGSQGPATQAAGSSGPTGPESPLRIGVAHAPVSSVLDTFAQTGADLVLAGHTHGGQVCLPGGRALVTNCDLPRSQAKGLSTITVASPQEAGSGQSARGVPLHVSAGIGTSATAPVRLFCPPEATLLKVHRDTE
ncbi:metallophosphoesterase [Nesterenkonia halotolerans]|uniref:MPP superfamily phosphohydrolase n=1 Tax=Nesterenkonia halotolerans TaxID=225325 RepID=A0ABR9J8C1_9MICC|nr:metallophosphoesterase [Nesterenkonia halotolerans]MBE1515223.1 putative MPP superfamily phosphohydrolase [Nesterenkonia halotolerans]